MTSLSDYDSSSDITNSDCIDLCVSSGCASSLLTDDKCDQECNLPECGYDKGNCGFCADNCFESDLSNSSQDSQCDTFECYFDSSLFKECSPGCLESMLINDICEQECNNSLCNFDYGNCNNVCIDGCCSVFLGNGICNEECNSEEFNFDDFDCTCSYECNDSKLSNSDCDEECNNENCDFDNKHCTCPDKCLNSSGNGICDEDCWTQECNWADSDCGCADNCRFEEISSCKKECLVSSCTYKDICTDQTKIKLSEFYQYIKRDFSVSIGIEDCLSDSQSRFNIPCTENDLRNNPCFTNSEGDQPCVIELCSFGLGECGTCSDCNKCYGDHCFDCLNKQFFDTCVEECPYGFTNESDICLPSASSEASPIDFYVTQLSTNSGTGDQTDPFSSLAMALANLYSEYSVIHLGTNQVYSLSPLPSNYSSLIEDNAKPMLRSNFNPKRVKIKGDNSILEIDGATFVLFEMSSGILEIESIRFSVRTLINGCEETECSYCSLESCGNCPDCSGYPSLDFIKIKSEQTLILKDVAFSDFRNNLNSIIHSEQGIVSMENVDFIKINAAPNSAVIKANSGSITYTGGQVKQLNDGNELYIESTTRPSLSSFMILDDVESEINDVHFSYNLIYNESLIQSSRLNTFSISESSFKNSVLLSGIMSLGSSSDNAFSLVQNNTIYELTTNKIEIKSIEFETNYVETKGLIYIEFDTTCYNTILEDITISNTNVLSSTLISIFTSNSELKSGFHKTYLKSQRKLAYYSQRYLNITNLKVSDSIIADKGIFFFEYLDSLFLNEIDLENNQEGEINLNDLVINDFISNTDTHGTVIHTLTSQTSLFSSFQQINTLSLDNFAIKNNNLETSVIIIATANALEIKDSNVKDINITTGLAFLYLQNISQISITNSTFESINNSVKDGSGVFKMETSQEGSIKIENSNFTRISSGDTSSVWSNYTNLYINDSNFTRNEGFSDLFSSVIYQVVTLSFNHSLTIEHCYFYENHSTIGWGGGISIDQTRNENTDVFVNVTDSVFDTHSSKNRGSGFLFLSGVYFKTGSIIENCVFRNHTNTEGAAVVFLETDREFTIDKSLFEELHSGLVSSIHHDGLTSFNLTVSNSEFRRSSGNTVIGMDSFVTRNTLNTKNCTYSENDASAIGLVLGVLYDEGSVIRDNTIVRHPSLTPVAALFSSELYFTWTQFINNKATKNAGIDLNLECFAICNHCQFIDNTSTNGGTAIKSQSSALTVRNSLFRGNKCTNGYGSSIFVNDTPSYNTTLENIESYENVSYRGMDFAFILCQATIINLNMHDNIAPQNGILVNIANVTLQDSQIHDQSSPNSPVFSMAFSRVEIFRSKIYNTQASERAGAIYMIYSTLLIEDSEIYDLEAPFAAFVYSTVTENFYLRNTNITNVQSDLGIIVLFEGSHTIENCNFYNNRGHAVMIENVNWLNVQNSHFVNGNYALSLLTSTGATVIECLFSNLISTSESSPLYASEISSLYIQSSVFTNNQSKNGGAITLNKSIASIFNNTFTNNSAYDEVIGSFSTSNGKGGAINLECQDNCQYSLTHNSFVNNSASFNGGAINWDITMPEITSNTFENNTALYGSDIASFPTDVQKIDSSPIMLVPGQLYTESSLFAIVDHYGTIVSTDNETQVAISSGNIDVRVSGQTIFPISQGILNLTNFIVSAQPSPNASISIASSASTINDGQIQFELRECIAGEVMVRNECVYCEPGTYSFSPDDDDCTECPENAICYGGFDVVPTAGYWRSSNTSSVFWPCPYAGACKGSPSGTRILLGECEIGYKGNKCQSCDETYSRSSKNRCLKCPDDDENVVKMVGIAIIITAVSVLIVRSSLMSAYKTRALHSVYIKIFLNYIQLVTITTGFDLDWPDLVLELFSVQETSSAEQLISFDCYSGESTFLYKALGLSLLPFVFIVISVGFWFMVSLANRNTRYMREECVSTVIILIFMIQPNIIKVMFDSLNCSEINESEFWLVVELDIQCWDGEHSFYALLIALPSIILWGLAVPAMVFLALFKNRKKLHLLNVRKKFGFLFNGYTRREYYWEIVILYRKIAILACLVVLGAVSVTVQALSAMLILVLFLIIQDKCTPYSKASLNQMEFFGIAVSAVTIYCGLYFLSGDLEEVSKILLFLLIVSMNIIFFCYWLKALCNVGLNSIAKKIPCLKKVVKGVRDGLDDGKFRLVDKSPHVYGEGADKMYTLIAAKEIKAPNLDDYFMRKLFLDCIKNELKDDESFYQ